jgi:hypothetical protein
MENKYIGMFGLAMLLLKTDASPIQNIIGLILIIWAVKRENPSV